MRPHGRAVLHQHVLRKCLDRRAQLLQKILRAPIFQRALLGPQVHCQATAVAANAYDALRTGKRPSVRARPEIEGLDHDARQLERGLRDVFYEEHHLSQRDPLDRTLRFKAVRANQRMRNLMEPPSENAAEITTKGTKYTKNTAREENKSKKMARGLSRDCAPGAGRRSGSSRSHAENPDPGSPGAGCAPFA